MTRTTHDALAINLVNVFDQDRDGYRDASDFRSVVNGQKTDAVVAVRP